MPDIVETEKSLPNRDKAAEYAIEIDSRKEILAIFGDWEDHGKKGVEALAIAAALHSIKMALQDENNPAGRIKEIKNFEEANKHYDAIINHKDEDMFGRATFTFRKDFESLIRDKIDYWYPNFLTPELREAAVILHARGNTTVNVIKHLLSPTCKTPNVFSFLLTFFPYLEPSIIKWLTPRLAYLKLGSPEFPKKYQKLWHESRAGYLEEIRGVTLTEITEQVKALSDLYGKLQDAFNDAKDDSGRAKLAASMVKVMSGLYTLTRDPSLKLPNSQEEKAAEDCLP